MSTNIWVGVRAFNLVPRRSNSGQIIQNCKFQYWSHFEFVFDQTSLKTRRETKLHKTTLFFSLGETAEMNQTAKTKRMWHSKPYILQWKAVVPQFEFSLSWNSTLPARTTSSPSRTCSQLREPGRELSEQSLSFGPAPKEHNNCATRKPKLSFFKVFAKF